MSSHNYRFLNWHYTELDDIDHQIRGRTLFFIILIFSISLFISVLFFYTRWVCRHYGHLPLTFSTTSAAQSSHAPPPPPPQGLDPTSIKKLPIILYQAPLDRDGGAWEESECCICLGEFREGEKVKCGFVYTVEEEAYEEAEEEAPKDETKIQFLLYLSLIYTLKEYLIRDDYRLDWTK
ncbi:unnamed protein product [Lupinus luteus]|uniref:RING/U-box superfamily protein n=1 Tax=Lupinus luteus TaxID=3873 RepID=A0AAV1XF40_LUPLU